MCLRRVFLISLFYLIFLFLYSIVVQCVCLDKFVELYLNLF